MQVVRRSGPACRSPIAAVALPPAALAHTSQYMFYYTCDFHVVANPPRSCAKEARHHAAAERHSAARGYAGRDEAWRRARQRSEELAEQ